MAQMKKTYIKDLKSVSGKVFLQGWIYEIRNLAKLKFILLRDRTGIVQCIAKGDETLMNRISGLTLESALLFQIVRPISPRRRRISRKLSAVGGSGSLSSFAAIPAASALPWWSSRW